MAGFFTDVRIETMRGLYTDLAGNRIGPEDREAYEAALDLTLNEGRQAQSVAYLRRNVLRNARFTAIRAAQNAQLAAAQRPLADAARRRVTWRNDVGTVQADRVDWETPEDHAIAAEMLRELRTAALGLGAHGQACFDALLDGMTAAETAAQTQVSISTVERCWRALRAHARVILTVPE
ncbi:sigma-70 family RNA polymerase sigma factor [Actinocrinis puniceicyclus]|uniref:Sigma-70 family RNA polymerase sigma factor n=1 Tax=Actinocrinis puniceicyclus TaxID=977794 RepID=A0A8J7WUY9_9ACTN|nr:ECF-type sigma factor [Actinocrinis puniceicyclus]MBS2965629.1 sigma-70 family RNA polymerase sigma factor [Actinocrinis puniceicyclus]